MLPLLVGASATGAPPDSQRLWHIQSAATPPQPIDTSAPPVAEGERAKALNALLPASAEKLSPASAFVLPWTQPESAVQALDCLTEAIYREAGAESLDGKQAVAQVVLNRLRHPAFPKTICGVVYQGSGRATGCQFTFTCDGSLARKPSAWGWLQARAVARSALAGYVFKGIGLATHYHADYVLPYWAPTLVKVGQIGAHIFYRWPGVWGEPSAFRASYAGNEHEPLITRASVSELMDTAPASSVDQAIPRVALTPAPGSPIGHSLIPASQAAFSSTPRPLRLSRPQEEYAGIDPGCSLERPSEASCPVAEVHPSTVSSTQR